MSFRHSGLDPESVGSDSLIKKELEQSHETLQILNQVQDDNFLVIVKALEFQLYIASISESFSSIISRDNHAPFTITPE